MDIETGAKQPIIYSRSWTATKNVHFAVDKDTLEEVVYHGDSKTDIVTARTKEVDNEKRKGDLGKDVAEKKKDLNMRTDKVNKPLEKCDNPDFVTASTDANWRSNQAVKRRNRSASYGRQKMSKVGSSRSIRSHSSGKYGFDNRKDDCDNNNLKDNFENQTVSLDILKKARNSQEQIEKNKDKNVHGEDNECQQKKEKQQKSLSGGLRNSRYKIE